MFILHTLKFDCKLTCLIKKIKLKKKSKNQKKTKLKETRIAPRQKAQLQK